MAGHRRRIHRDYRWAGFAAFDRQCQCCRPPCQRSGAGNIRPVAAARGRCRTAFRGRRDYSFSSVLYPGRCATAREYPYRPGLTVVQAISAAGGYYRLDLGLPLLRLDRDVALAKGDIRTLSLKQNRLVMRAARLTASLAGQESVPIPPELENEKQDATISAIIESERAALARENDMARSEARALESIS